MNGKNIIDVLVLKKTSSTTIQIFRYLFVGGIAAVFNFGILYFSVEFLSLHYLIGAFISYIIAAIITYPLCLKWVFDKNRHSHSVALLTIFVISSIGLEFHEIILYILVDFFSIYYLLANLVSAILIFFWNFFARKTYLF